MLNVRSGRKESATRERRYKLRHMFSDVNMRHAHLIETVFSIDILGPRLPTLLASAGVRHIYDESKMASSTSEKNIRNCITNQ